MPKVKLTKKLLLLTLLSLFLTTCTEVPDYCSKKVAYDPSCQFCFGGNAYSQCGGARYNPLKEGCVASSDIVGTLCMDSSVVAKGTPCGGYMLTTAVTPEGVGRIERTPDGKTTFAAGEDLILNAIPADTGYEFAGWAGAHTSKDKRTTYRMSGNKPQVAIVAMFKPKGEDGMYTLGKTAYPENGGFITVTAASSPPDPNTGKYEHGTTLTVTAAPNLGYMFDGWSGTLAASKEQPAIRLTMDETKTLVALFVPTVHTLNTVAKPAEGGAVFVNGSALSAQEVGTEIVAVANPMPGYVFVNWSGAGVEGLTDNPAMITVSGGMTLTANFKTGNGRPITAPSMNPALTTAAEPVNGGSVTRNPDSDVYTLGTRVTVTAAAKEGYRFTGWEGALTSNNQNETITMDGDKALTAKFEKIPEGTKSFPLTAYAYPATGGTVTREPDKANYNEGEEVTLTAAAHGGYRFVEWSGAGGASFSTERQITVTMNGELSLTARFAEAPVVPDGYKITFDANGGTVTPTSMMTDGDGRLTGSLPVPTRSGYTFGGWYTSATGGTQITTGTTFTANTVVFARWTLNTYTIEFDANGGTVTPTSMMTSGDGRLTGSLPVPTRSGYTFGGWYTATTGGTQITTGTTFTANTVVFARWTVNPVTGGNNCTSAGTCKTVEIVGVTWMAENLNIETADSWCYGNNPDSCVKYGRLYTYDAAVSACELLGSGWHLPSREEWQELVRAVDPNAQLTNGGWDDNNVAGRKLKSTSGWYNNGNGTDSLGFSALPGGYRYSDGGFYNAGYIGYWWTATEYGSSYAYTRDMYYNVDYVNENYYDKSYGFSVRCRRD